MRQILFLVALASLVSEAFAEDHGKHLFNIKQLTSGGNQNAEAYWSPDGKRLVFQSTRPPHECDQIYIMNADGSDQHIVSTGKGVTTCAYFTKDNKHIVYASTHERAPACPPRPDRSKGYVWAVYAGFDIYYATDAGTILKKLTDAEGYDAEATINWKTNQIIYTSLASGDLELWKMKVDGSDKQKLTSTAGYDGGPVFSRDGKQIVWRAHHPTKPEDIEKSAALLKDNLTTPMKMELLVADADGRNAKTITDYGCANFAPTFTPDGKKILFASNKHKCDGRDFELYLVNTDGSGLEQVTTFGGFTSFPEFSPDGKKLVFASSHKGTGRYEFNIFTADWKP